MKKRSARITVETERLLFVRSASRGVESWCEACREKVRMLQPDEASALAGISQRMLFRRAEAGEIHFWETRDGQTRFCLNSLVKLPKRELRD